MEHKRETSVMLRIFKWAPATTATMGLYSLMQWAGWFTPLIFNITLPGGIIVPLTGYDLYLLFGLGALGYEGVKASDMSIAIPDLILSFAVTIAALIVFFVFPFFGTKEFLFALSTGVVDVFISIFVTIRTARRDFGLHRGDGTIA